jgi:hypothetical protein
LAEQEKQADQEEQNPEADKHKTQYFSWWRNPSDRFSFFLVVFTGVLAVATIWLGCETHKLSAGAENQIKVMQGQLDEYKATRRPWIYVQANIAGPVSITENTIDIPIVFTLKNTGTTPGMAVSYDAAIADELSENAPIQTRIKSMCKNAKESPEPHIGDSFFGYTVFPKQDFTIYDSSFSMDRKHIESAYQRLYRDVINPPKRNVFRPEIFGCLKYKFTFEEGWHITPFRFEIYNKSAIGKDMKLSTGEIPVSNLALVYSNKQETAD